MSGRKHRPAVAHPVINSLRPVSVSSQPAGYRSASCAVKGTGSGSILLLSWTFFFQKHSPQKNNLPDEDFLRVIQVPVLFHKPPIGIEVRNLQTVDSLLSVQEVNRHQFTSPVNLPLLEEKSSAAWLSQGCSKNLAYLLASRRKISEFVTRRKPS